MGSLLIAVIGGVVALTVLPRGLVPVAGTVAYFAIALSGGRVVIAAAYRFFERRGWGSPHLDAAAGLILGLFVLTGLVLVPAVVRLARKAPTAWLDGRETGA